MRPFAGERDRDALLDLLCACVRADTADMEFYSITMRNGRDDDHPSGVIERSPGELDAYAVLWHGRYLGTLRRPDADPSMFDALLDWGFGIAGAQRLSPLARSDDLDARSRLDARGLVLVEREHRMRRSLDAPIPAPAIPPGFEVRPLDSERDLDAWLDLYAAAIGDRPFALAKWRAYRLDPDYRPDLDLIAVDADDLLVGACTVAIARHETAVCGWLEGRTEPIMVAEQYRRIGLGRALVLAGLRRLRDAGMRHAALTVESDNPAAIQLYRSLGYVNTYDACWYEMPG